MRTNPIVHTRLIIVDEKEIIVSSADMSRAQFFDEYNAGIWTKNPEVVRNAVDFFNNVWNVSDPLT